jgi:hypothetical protein
VKIDEPNPVVLSLASGALGRMRDLTGRLPGSTTHNVASGINEMLPNIGYLTHED